MSDIGGGSRTCTRNICVLHGTWKTQRYTTETTWYRIRMGARRIHGSFMTILGGFQRCRKCTRGVSSSDGMGEVSARELCVMRV